MYAAADDEADRLGEIEEGTEVDVVSILSEFVLIKERGRYTYIPRRSLSINTDYDEQYGPKKACSSAEPVLLWMISPESFALIEKILMQSSYL